VGWKIHYRQNGDFDKVGSIYQGVRNALERRGKIRFFCANGQMQKPFLHTNFTRQAAQCAAQGTHAAQE